MHRAFSPVLLVGLLPIALAGCHPGYSPNTYASAAAQQEAAVQRGTIIGVRQVLISATGAVGAVTGGAVGGVAGSQLGAGAVGTALGAIGGTLVGGIGGTAAAQAVSDTKGWEYIVQEEPGDKLVSVTQTSKIALPIGLHVLVISDLAQARIVPDYTVQIAAAPPPPRPAPANLTAAEINISPLLPANPAAPLPVAPGATAIDPAASPTQLPAAAAPATPPTPAAITPAAANAPAAGNAAAAPAMPVTGSAVTSVQSVPGSSTPPSETASPAAP